MPKSNPRRRSDFKIHEGWNRVGDMDANKYIKKLGGDEIAKVEGKDNGEALSQLQDPPRFAEENSEMEESEIRGDSILDQELSELQEDDSILEDTKTKHNEHDDCEDCKHAREEKRKHAEARDLQLQKIEAEIRAAALKVVENFEKDDLEWSRAANGHNDSILSTQTDQSYEPEDHDNSFLNAKIDETDEQNSHNGQRGTELTNHTTKATLEDDGHTEDEDSILHHDLLSSDAENERESTSGEGIVGGDKISHFGDVEDDVFSNDSGKSPRFSMGSEDEAPQRVNMSNRSSWQSNRQLDLSKEAHQLIELNSPVVGEEASTESIISRIPSGASHASAPRARDSFCISRKVQRHPFRTPSNIRAMQMYSPAPSLFSTPHSSKRQHPTVSRLGTPTGSQYSKSRTPTRFRKNREESPLVLLHVTVLPLRWQYSKAIVAPELPANLYNIREAYYLLQEKLSDTILSRGILLPHPQDSYECLEERFLDALELPVRPRAKILRCGHYMGPNNNSSDDDSADEGDSGFGSTGRFKNRPDKVWCDICRRDVRYEDDDQDEDDKRFNVKIFASNGLMRAGAWAAAWREMERVDVEIEPFVQPWMVEDMEDLIERLREAEERERGESYDDHYSSDDEDRESLGSEAQRLHEEEMAKVTLRQKTVDAESRYAREEWLAAASRAAEEEAVRTSRETEALRLQEEEIARAEEEEARRLEEIEALQIHEEMEAAQKAEEEADRIRLELETLRVQEKEAKRLRIEAEVEAIRLAEEMELAQKLTDLKSESSKANEGKNHSAKELEAEAQQLYEAEAAEPKSIEDEAQRTHKAQLAEQKALEEEAKKIIEEETSRKVNEDEELEPKLQERAKLAEEARLKNIYNQASAPKEESSPSPRTNTPAGNESLTEFLIKAAGLAMRDRKNILIVILSVVVLFLALKPSKEVAMSRYTPDIIIQNHRYEVGNQGEGQRGYEALRQATADGILPMREIESSMRRKSQEVMATSPRKSHDSIVMQSDTPIETKGKPIIMEIDATGAVPIMGESSEEVAILGAVEHFVEGVATSPISGSNIEIEGVVAKDIPAVNLPSDLNTENIPISESQDDTLTTGIDTQL
ncbi:hypothetical protein DID88_000476 [Monilinia fructigena]|uniref:Pathway-specific nitrogen regulator n=1 Tax=Monilinia fructigena TaxID=38457 RepID=A0A395IHM4_9HELO|nr:hypothetical protein DID88_000476 [Monilinia fructigena]